MDASAHYQLVLLQKKPIQAPLESSVTVSNRRLPPLVLMCMLQYGRARRTRVTDTG
ncbi:Uncharacterized protein DAT39_011366 [Clarias magur]|uniref:Uncharacterized protein n=1 Tax=Clarias magur TaxID=1594786 RepID=A0A8J4UMJ2_CLAMG|nr:Uncharacterized protein DAT39_011366 [Clarias magur]